MIALSSLPPQRHDAAGMVLPLEVRTALSAIAADLRHMPRCCVYDKAELVCWLSRIARRVEAERDRKVPPPPRHPIRPAAPHRVQSIRDRAEAVFKASPMPPKPRTVTSRKGKAVRVETRRSGRFSEQIEMQLWGDVS